MQDLASPDKETIQNIFDHIASRYDTINSLLSFCIDETWRKKAADLILKEKKTGRKVLDLGVGTGKFLNQFLKRKACDLAVGVDFSKEMLIRAKAHLNSSSSFLQADIHELPFQNQSFDLVISSFTLRSVKDRGHFFKEVFRILEPGGSAAFLCLTRPTSFIGKAVYAPYLKFYLPLMGGVLARDPVAYQFLSQSIQSFPRPEEIGKEMSVCGLKLTHIVRFTFGISTLMLARK